MSRHPSRAELAARRYAQTPKGQYERLRNRAQRKGVGFRLSLAQWRGVWEESGHFADHALPGFVMVRKNNTGAYELGNVAIVRKDRRHDERGRVYPHRPSAEWEAEYEDRDWKHVHELPED